MRSLVLLLSVLALAACSAAPATTQTASAARLGHEGDGSPLTTCNR
jgi:uncharacterized lipoprotein YajG